MGCGLLAWVLSGAIRQGVEQTRRVGACEEPGHSAEREVGAFQSHLAALQAEEGKGRAVIELPEGLPVRAPGAEFADEVDRKRAVPVGLGRLLET